MFSVFLGEYFSAHWFIAQIARDLYLQKKNSDDPGHSSDDDKNDGND